MRKTIALILAVCTLLSFTVAASADTFTSTTTLTTKVPAASYTMKIPANQTIQYGVEYTDIGNVTIENSQGFSTKKNIEVTVGFTEFTSKGVDTTIPYEIMTVWGPSGGTIWNFDREAVLRFEGQQDGSVKSNATSIDISGVTKNPPDLDKQLTQMAISISSDAWANALAGDYTSTITFTSKVVAVK